MSSEKETPGAQLTPNYVYLKIWGSNGEMLISFSPAQKSWHYASQLAQLCLQFEVVLRFVSFAMWKHHKSDLKVAVEKATETQGSTEELIPEDLNALATQDKPIYLGYNHLGFFDYAQRPYVHLPSLRFQDLSTDENPPLFAIVFLQLY
jgi:hypothetical protein